MIKLIGPIKYSYQHEEEGDQKGHPALDVLRGDEERRPADHDEEGAGQVVRDHVVGHATSEHHFEACHAVIT